MKADNTHIYQLIKANLMLAETNTKVVDINKTSLDMIKEQLNHTDQLIQLCGETHHFLNLKKNKTWEEEELCRKLYQQITGFTVGKKK